MGPIISGALTEFFDFQTSALVSKRDTVDNNSNSQTLYLIVAFW